MEKTKKYTPKNKYNSTNKEIKKAIKDLKKMRPTGIWWDAPKIKKDASRTLSGIEITVTEIPPYNFDFYVWLWCDINNFPLPENEEEENKIKWLYDYQLFVFKNTLSEFITDIIEILTWERARLFYLWFFVGILLFFYLF